MYYNLEPLKAMDIYYDGEQDGVWEGEFIKGEAHGLVYPSDLREFLECYGNMDVNRNPASFRIYYPGNMEEILLQTQIGDIPILLIGVFENYLTGIRLDKEEELPVAFGEQTQDGVMWSPVNLTFSGMLVSMLVSVLFQSKGHTVFDSEEGICGALAQYGADQESICPGEGCPQHFSLNYNSDMDMFLIAEFDEACEQLRLLHVIPRRMLTLEELNQLFAQEFYTNAMHCDYRHALELQRKIIERMEEASDPGLAEHYKLAGICCRELEQFDAAEIWYEKGLAEMERNLADAFNKAASYYHALGNFYTDIKQSEKGERYYEKGLKILRQYFPEEVEQIGRIYQSQAQFLVKGGGDPERAVELYNKALEEFQKQPKKCKYDIARTQQLRGDAKRLKKNGSPQG